MKEDRKLVTFRIEPMLWEKFGRKARKYGTNRSKILRIMIRNFIGEKVDKETIFVNENG